MLNRSLAKFTTTHAQYPGATFSKLLRKILEKDSYLIDDLGKTAILKTS